MKINFTPIGADRKMNPYRKRDTGNLVYVYNIEGTPEQIAEYKAANPKAITDSKSGKVLFFTTKFVGKSADLVKSEKGWFVDDSELVMFGDLEKQYGTTIAREKMAEMKSK